MNLERLRWVLHAVSGKFVAADVAGFNIYVYNDDELLWTTRVQVGKPYRETPVFKSEIKYIELNPTWTIPPGILAKDVLPAVKKDPNYLKARNIKGKGSALNFLAINFPAARHVCAGINPVLGEAGDRC